MTSPRRPIQDRSRTRAPASPRSSPAYPPIPARHPAFLAAGGVATIGICLSVGFRIHDPDIWQHLAVGRAIWSTHSIPMYNVWVWPAYGTPAVLPSWGFRALLW